jgi:hypothetical protein
MVHCYRFIVWNISEVKPVLEKLVMKAVFRSTASKHSIWERAGNQIIFPYL